jgi:hypothetical protein
MNRSRLNARFDSTDFPNRRAGDPYLGNDGNRHPYP